VDISFYIQSQRWGVLSVSVGCGEVNHNDPKGPETHQSFDTWSLETFVKRLADTMTNKPIRMRLLCSQNEDRSPLPTRIRLI
jgi:hypothetical protein